MRGGATIARRRPAAAARRVLSASGAAPRRSSRPSCSPSRAPRSRCPRRAPRCSAGSGSRASRSSARSRGRRRARRWISGPPTTVERLTRARPAGPRTSARRASTRRRCRTARAPPRSSTPGRSSCRRSARRPRRSSRRRSAPARRSSDSTSTARPAFWITGAHGFAYQSRLGVRVRAAADRRATRCCVERRDGLLLRIEGVQHARPRDRDRPLSSVTGPRASSPAARSDGPCGAGPPPTARRGPA